MVEAGYGEMDRFTRYLIDVYRHCAAMLQPRPDPIGRARAERLLAKWKGEAERRESGEIDGGAASLGRADGA